MCRFVEAQDQVFGYEEVQDALDEEVRPLFG